MQLSKCQTHPSTRGIKPGARRPGARPCAAISVGATLAGFMMISFASLSQQPQAQSNPDKSIHPATLTALPDANAQMQMHDQQSKAQNFAAANAERQRQIADDSAKLLKLAADLKAEVEKTDKDTLSLNVIRKADEIERLARSVKEKMKLTVGGS